MLPEHVCATKGTADSPLTQHAGTARKMLRNSHVQAIDLTAHVTDAEESAGVTKSQHKQHLDYI